MEKHDILPKNKVIIDTDPGIDDCAAIMFAAGLENLGKIQLLALTTVAGNVSLANTQKNARIICDWIKRKDLPVFAGAHEPIIKKSIIANDVHGQTGLGDAILHEPDTPLQNKSAIDYLSETLSSATARSIILCAIGPLTNIALAIKTNPACIQGIKELVIMGGSFFEIGNITPNAEFNFFSDPLAVKIILSSNIPISILPLDVTHKACITTPRIEQLRRLPNQNGTRIANMLQSYSRFDIQEFGLKGGPLHDPCAIAYLIQPHLFRKKTVYANIEINESIMEGAVQIDWNHQFKQSPNVNWCYDINADQFFEIFTQAIATLP